MLTPSAQRVAGQSVDPRLVILSVQEPPSLGHGRDGVVHPEAAVLKKVGKQTRLLPRIDADEPSDEILEMHGREMDRVTIIAGYDGADHATTPELAIHGVADDLAAAP